MLDNSIYNIEIHFINYKTDDNQKYDYMAMYEQEIIRERESIY